MNKQDFWKRTEDIETDLLQMLRMLFIQWKKMAACALVLAVVFGGYSYFRSLGSTVVPDMDATSEAELTEEEKENVEAAAALEKAVRGLEEYLDHSVLMQADPYHKNRAVMLYSIDHAKRQELQKITESYLNFLVNGGASDALKKKENGGWDMDKSYLNEMITAYQKTYSFPYMMAVDSAVDEDILAGSLFCVEVTGKDRRMAKQLAADIQSVLDKQYAVVKETIGGHKLTFISSEESIQADSGLQSQQRDKRALLSADRANLKSITDAFSKEQMKAYQEITGIEDSREESVEEIGSVIEKPRISRKMILLGAVAGICLYSGIFVCWYLAQDTLKSIDEINAMYTFPFYGGIHFSKKTKRAAGKNSDAGMSVREQDKEQVLNRIRLSCKKHGISRLCAAAAHSFDAQEKECIGSMAEQLRYWGIDISVFENAGKDTDGWDDLAETGQVLMVCRIGTTTHRMVDEAMRFYTENDITVAGAIAFVPM